MKKTYFGIILSLCSLFCSCHNKANFFIKNTSFVHQKIVVIIRVDGATIMSDTLKYDNSEYGHISLQKEMNKGDHIIEVVLPSKKISKTENIKMDNGSKFIYITILDNTSARNYSEGDLKISISFKAVDTLQIP